MHVIRLSGWWMVLLLSVVTLRASSDKVPLIEAVKKGDAQGVRSLITQHADVNTPEADGTTALHWAAHRDDLQMADVLIRNGANVKAANRYGVTPLSLACENGNAAIIQRLLKAGADPNTVLGGETVLMTAARTGNVDAVTVLLAQGADVQVKENWRGQTALMWAAAEGHAALAQTLIDNGADVHARSNRGTTPLLFAIRAGHVDAVNVLLSVGANVNDLAGEGLRPAPATKPTSSVITDADPVHPEFPVDGTSALVVAIINAHYELAASLLDKGADPNVDGPGGTALHALVRARNVEHTTMPDPVPTGGVDTLELAKMLIAHGADPNARMTMMPPKMGILDVNYLNLLGATPFFLAARAADVSFMRFLVANGADPLLPNNEGTTPLMVAAGIGYCQGQSVGSETARLEAARLAVELGGDIHAVNERDQTALHGSSYSGANAVVRFLVDNGARLDATDKLQRTPLSIAEGVFYSSALHFQHHTAALLRQLMSVDESK